MRAYGILTAAMLAIAPVGASIAHEPDRAQTVAEIAKVGLPKALGDRLQRGV